MRATQRPSGLPVSAPTARISSAALVLNATYEPLCVISARRAAVLVLTEKAVLVTASETVLHSVSRSVPSPVVVRLTRYVRVPFRGSVTLTRRAIFARDRGRCVYCDTPATTVDHVIPRSRGGRHVWNNVVAACTRCNHTKADHTLAELGWHLRQQPIAPMGAVWRILGHRRPDPRWLDWLDLAHPVSRPPAKQAVTA